MKTLKFLRLFFLAFAIVCPQTGEGLTSTNASSIQAEKEKRLSMIQDRLEGCLLSSLDERKLKEQILAGASTLHPCFLGGTGEDASIFSLNQVRNLQQVKSLARKTLDDRGFVNMVHTFAKAGASLSLYKLDFVFDHGGFDSKLNKVEALKNTCADCSQSQKSLVSSVLSFHAKEIQQSFDNESLRKFTFEQAVEKLNRSVDVLNAQIKLVGEAKKNGDEEKAKEYHQAYLLKYAELTNDPVGSLLFSPIVEKRVRSFRTMDDIKKPVSHPNRPTQDLLVNTSYHAKIEGSACNMRLSRNRCNGVKDMLPSEVVRNALKERKNRVLEHLASVEKERNLNELLKLNPIAVGQALMRHPEFLDRICEGIAKIATDDQNTKAKMKAIESGIETIEMASLAFMAFGGVGGLLVKSFAFVAKKSFSAASSRLLANGSGRLMTVSGYGAMAGAGINRAASGYGYAHHQLAFNEALGARLAGATTPDQMAKILETHEEINKYGDKLRNSNLEFVGGGALSLLGRLRKVASSSKDIEELMKNDDELADTLKALSNNERNALSEKLGEALKVDGIEEEHVNSLMVLFSQLDEADRLQYMSQLEKLEPNKLTAILRAAKQEVSQCL